MRLEQTGHPLHTRALSVTVAAAAELEDLGPGTGGVGPGGAQVVDAERDRLRDAVGAALVDQAQKRGELEERAEHAAVHGRQTGVTDDLVAKRQHALEPPLDLLDLDAEEARVGNRLEDAVHDRLAFCSSCPIGAPLRLAPIMNAPMQLANGSAGSRS